MLLAIDTSTRQIGLALFNGYQVISQMTWYSPFHHTVELTPAVNRMFEHARIQAGDLQAIGAAIGPGSFTALRSGLAFAKGLALVENLPVVGINSLDVTAASQPEASSDLLAILEAGRKRFAVQRFTLKNGAWIGKTPAELVTIEQLNEMITSPTWICGELSKDNRRALSKNPEARLATPAQCIRQPGVLAELAWQRWQKGDVDDPALLAPQYLATEGITG